MKAVVQDHYGSVESLETKDLPRPAIDDRDVLVRVRAAALHIGDAFSVTGSPLAMRLATGLTRPRYGVPGYDLAGRIEVTGSSVIRFRPGDEVFGYAKGTCADYVRVPEDKLALRPANLSFEQAAALPTSGLAALHGLRDAGKVRPGQHVLIIGASGGVGSFAVQIAKALGAEVTAVTSTHNIDAVRSLGADHVVDYTREDFAAHGAQYDLIFDNVESRSLDECRRALKPDGTLVLNSGTAANGLSGLLRMVRPLALSPFARQTFRRYLSRPNTADLEVLKALAEEGRLRPLIDRTYPLSDTSAALRYIQTGHARGKVVITMAEAEGETLPKTA